MRPRRCMAMPLVARVDYKYTSSAKPTVVHMRTHHELQIQVRRTFQYAIVRRDQLSRITHIPASHRIPNEMLRKIVQEVAFTSPYSSSLPSSISLVCLSWAQFIRPVMWKKITIPSEDKLRALISLITTSHHDRKQIPKLTALAKLIVYVHLKCDFSDSPLEPPWVHLAYPTLRPLLPSLSDDVTLSVGGRKQISLFLSFYSGLPFTAPNQFTFIKVISFEHIRVPSREVLLRALSHLKSLRVLGCVDLQWDAYNLPSVACALSSTVEVINIRTTDDAPMSSIGWWISPLIGHRYPATSRPARPGTNVPCVLGERDYYAMEHIVSCLEDAVCPGGANIYRQESEGSTSGSYILLAWSSYVSMADDS